MFVPVMEIRRVRVRVPNAFVHVFVNMRFGTFVSSMDMPVMLVMNVTMGVCQISMRMLVRLRFRQNQPGCDCHEYCGRKQW